MGDGLTGLALPVSSPVRYVAILENMSRQSSVMSASAGSVASSAVSTAASSGCGETGSESRPSPAPSFPQPRARPPTTDRQGRLHFPIPVPRPRRPCAQLRLLRPGEPVPSDSSYLELARLAEWPGRPRQPPPCLTSTLPVSGCCCACAPVRLLFRPGSPPGLRPLGSGFRVPRGELLSQLFPCPTFSTGAFRPANHLRLEL